MQPLVRACLKNPAVGYEIQVDFQEGWTSGRSELMDGLEVKLPLPKSWRASLSRQRL